MMEEGEIRETAPFEQVGRDEDILVPGSGQEQAGRVGGMLEYSGIHEVDGLTGSERTYLGMMEEGEIRETANFYPARGQVENEELDLRCISEDKPELQVPSNIAGSSVGGRWREDRKPSHEFCKPWVPPLEDMQEVAGKKGVQVRPRAEHFFWRHSPTSERTEPVVPLESENRHMPYSGSIVEESLPVGRGRTKTRREDRQDRSGTAKDHPRREVGESQKRRREHSPEEICTSGVKKPRGHQWCPMKGCSVSTKYLRGHVMFDHLPELYRLPGTLSPHHSINLLRLQGLELLASLILGEGAEPYNLIKLVQLEQSLRGGTIRPSDCLVMRDLCQTASWEVPCKFTIEPFINSPAVLVYWRILAGLIDRLSARERDEFHEFCSKALQSLSQEPDSHHPGAVYRYERDIQESRDRSRPRDESSRVRREHVVPERSGVEVSFLFERDIQPLSLTATGPPLRAFDSHFNLDRTAGKLFNSRDVGLISVEDILTFPQVPQPYLPISLEGGVIVYCDPPSRISFTLAGGSWKVAVGVHPRKIKKCTENYMHYIKTLLDTNDAVVALGDIGLDRTEDRRTWADQDEFFQKVLLLSRPDKVLVLHLRGHCSEGTSDVLMKALLYVSRVCPREQRIHIHCFTGTPSDVQEWMMKFPNCHFGFTAMVEEFSPIQVLGLRAVPSDRFLLETDSPYMEPHRTLVANTPAYLGDVAYLVAKQLEIPVEHLLRVATENVRRLYRL